MASACASSIAPALRARVSTTTRRTAGRSTRSVRAMGMDMKQGSGAETVEVVLDRPMGLQLNSGREGIGAYVAGIVPDGNAAKEGSVRVGDVMVSCGPTGVDARDVDFDVIMDTLAENPEAPTMNITFKRWPDTLTRPPPRGTSGSNVTPSARTS